MGICRKLLGDGTTTQQLRLLWESRYIAPARTTPKEKRQVTWRHSLQSNGVLATAYRNHTLRHSYPLLWWRHCTCGEVSLPSRCLETRCITPFFYCCLLERVYVAVAWQCVDQIHYNILIVEMYRSSYWAWSKNMKAKKKKPTWNR
jgi:hypothetical protein